MSIAGRGRMGSMVARTSQHRPAKRSFGFARHSYTLQQRLQEWSRRKTNEQRTCIATPRCRRLTGIRVVGAASTSRTWFVGNDHLHPGSARSDWIVKRTGILERRTPRRIKHVRSLCRSRQGFVRKNRMTERTATSRPRHLHTGHVVSFHAWSGAGPARHDRPGDRSGSRCAGFMYALITAAAYVKAGLSDRALVIGGRHQ